MQNILVKDLNKNYRLYKKYLKAYIKRDGIDNFIKWLDTIGTLRACFYIYNDFEDCDKFIQAVKDSAEYFKEW